MKKLILSMPVMALIMFLAGCQKGAVDSGKGTSASIVTPKPVVYVRTDTTTRHAMTDASGIRMFTTGDVFLRPTYLGNSSYRLKASIVLRYSYDIIYTLFKDGSAFQTSQITSANDYTFTVDGTPSTYYVQIRVLGNDNYSGTYNTPSFRVVTKPVAPAGMISAYRYYSPESHQHLISSDWEELASGSNGFQFEKPVCFIYDNPFAIANLKPIYRYYNASNGDHFTTDIYNNYQGYILESTTGYIGTYQTADLTAGFNLYIASIPYRFVCATPEVPLDNNYHLERTIGYVKPAN
jgi:hypothetical protein